MEGERRLEFADREHIMQLLWNTISATSDTSKNAFLDGRLRDSSVEHHETLEFNKRLSESAPNLDMKLDSGNYIAPQRLCKSTDTLLVKRCRQQSYGGQTTSQDIVNNIKCGKPFQCYAEFDIIRRPCKNRRGARPSFPDSKRMLHIGNLNQITAPLDYTLCLANCKTHWESQENIKDGKAVVCLNINTLAKHVDGLLVGFAILRESGTGSIIAQFTNLEDMDRITKLPLSKIFGTKVKTWRISSRCQYSPDQQSSQCTPQTQPFHQRQPYSSSPRRRLNNYNCYSYRRYLIAPDIPDTVPAPEIQNALRFQGLRSGQVWRHMPRGFRIEVLRPCDYDRLCRDGVNFFNVAAFPVYPSSRENLASRSNASGCDGNFGYKNISQSKSETQDVVPEIPFAILQQTQHRENIQCFKCQRYGHKATHCKYWTRCVRCGGKHKVIDCDVPMTAASCCLCKGPHHAASHECPVHNAHANAVQVAFAMARTNFKPCNIGNM